MQPSTESFGEMGSGLYPNCDADIWLRSCEKEIPEPIDGIVTGIIPQWLNGSLIRNGPGSLKVGTQEFKHLFDKSALLHRFHIKDGKVSYQCKFLQSDAYKKYWASDRIVFTEFGTCSVPDPCKTIFQRISAIFWSNEISDNSMISVYPFGDEIYAFTEIPAIHRIDVNTLDTIEKVDTSKYVSIVNHTAHPHVMNDGTVYNAAISMTLTGPYHNIVCFPPSRKTKNGAIERSMFDQAYIVCGVPARWTLHPSYMHSFGITKNYFIIIEQPLTISLLKIFKLKFCGNTLRSCMEWFDNESTVINIICRKTGKLIKRFETEPFFFLHIINQYEIDNTVILDVCCYKDAYMLDCMYVEALQNIQSNPDYAKLFRGRPLRFVLPLDNESISIHQLCDMGCETPRINYDSALGTDYKYFYAISADVDADNPGTIIKVNVKTRKTLTWCEVNCYPSEPIFVPSPNSQKEDEGVVLSALVWGKEMTNKVGLLILDAVTMKEIGRCTFDTPTTAPKCLHGWFLPNK